MFENSPVATTFVSGFQSTLHHSSSFAAFEVRRTTYDLIVYNLKFCQDIGREFAADANSGSPLGQEIEETNQAGCEFIVEV